MAPRLKAEDMREALAKAIDPEAFERGDIGRQAVAYTAAERCAKVLNRFVRFMAWTVANG
jgi:hypothetical protein